MNQLNRSRKPTIRVPIHSAKIRIVSDHVVSCLMRHPGPEALDLHVNLCGSPPVHARPRRLNDSCALIGSLRWH